MSNVILISDLHLADKSPANCTDSYTEDLLDLLDQTVQLAKDNNAVAVWAGDVFHIKQPSRNSHKLVQDTIDVVNAYPNGLYIVPGNHDLTFDRMDSLDSQPLGTLFKSGAKLLEGWSDDYDFLYGVPWLQRFRQDTVDEAFLSWRACYTDRPMLAVTHAPLYPPGKELPYEFYPSEDWANSMGNVGSCFYGHVHAPHGVWKSAEVSFCNNGALSRGSLDEYNINRPVVATLWSSINGEFRTLPLSYKPASEVFRLVEHKEAKQKQVKLDDFLNAVGQATIEITSIESVMAHIQTLNLGESLERAIQELLASAE
jgi:DNA repair exonuclease SbcCD nuclease subunit